MHQEISNSNVNTNNTTLNYRNLEEEELVAGEGAVAGGCSTGVGIDLQEAEARVDLQEAEAGVDLQEAVVDLRG
ncbi:hypothetical protein LXL04_008788 [Taraxacum kok-saghyz]